MTMCTTVATQRRMKNTFDSLEGTCLCIMALYSSLRTNGRTFCKIYCQCHEKIIGRAGKQLARRKRWLNALRSKKYSDCFSPYTSEVRLMDRLGIVWNQVWWGWKVWRGNITEFLGFGSMRHEAKSQGHVKDLKTSSFNLPCLPNVDFPRRGPDEAEFCLISWASCARGQLCYLIRDESWPL